MFVCAPASADASGIVFYRRKLGRSANLGRYSPLENRAFRDEALVLKAVSGFVEAPSVSLDREELLFQKKVGDRFAIYRPQCSGVGRRSAARR